MKIAKKISFSAILVAVAVVILYFGSLIDVVTLSVAAVASFSVMITVAELGYFTGLGVYAAASLLSLLLLPSKETAVVFAAFFGFYPIVKGLADKLKKPLAYTVKTFVFMVSFTVSLLVFIFFFSLPPDKWFLYLLMIIPGLAVFYIYDYLFTKIIIYYFGTLRKKLGISKYFKQS